MATPTSLGGVSPVPLTGQNYIDSLLDYYKWGGSIGTGANISYSFRSNSSYYSTGVNEYGPSTGSGEPWKSGWHFLTDTQKIGIAAALNAWAEVANITFTEAFDSLTVAGDIRFSTEPGITRSHAWYPWQSARAGDVWFTTDVSGPSNLDTAEKGTFGYLTFLHEIGHALGLSHPHGGRAIAASSINALPFSVMSYQDYVGDTGDTWDSGLLPTTPMLNDIAIIQYLYGPNMGTRSGDTTYSWTVGRQIYETIWDGGGNDAIDWSNQFSAATINLNAGQWSYLGPNRWDGHAFTQQNLAIAYTVVIENATGGSGNDTLIGNSANNTLNGGAGNDQLFGNAGNDLFDWDANSRDGADTMYGGLGDDQFVVNSQSDVVVELPNEGVDLIWSNTTYSIANVGNVERLFLFSSQSANATGNALDNLLRGNDANNVIDGGAGTDTSVYSGNRTSYTITKTSTGFTVSGSTDGTDTLSNIERLQFSDRKLAFDLGLNTAGGNTVRIIGAAFDAPTIQAHLDYVGIGLSFFDSGMSLQAVCQLVIGVMGNPTNVAFVNTVYQNVVGAPPPQGERDFYVGLLVGSIGGTMTQAQLLELAANAEVNAEMNINLVGLQQSGVEFVSA